MSQNRCDRCGRLIKDPNAKYGWRCAEIIAAGGSLTIDLSAIFSMLEKYADFSFESQNDLFDISEIFEKMLTLSSAPYSMQAENDYVEKGAALAFAMFSNYDELGDKARKSAVSHFIEEMHRAEKTLPPPSLRYTLAEQMNNKLIDYYEEENNPNTNDTVEDTIDELFGNIPLYHYLNAMFARTEAEFDDSLIKGLEGSFNAFMSLPYASSMMGDIAVIEPQMAFVPEPYVSQAEAADGINFSIKYKPSSGAILKTNPDKTTTILGRYLDDTKEIIEELQVSKSTDFSGNKGGFNVLNTPDELYLSADQYWAEYNKPFIDQVILRGDDIILATKPSPDKLYMDDGKVLTGFGREYYYLIDKGYVYDNKLNKMIKNR